MEGVLSASQSKMALQSAWSYPQTNMEISKSTPSGVGPDYQFPHGKTRVTFFANYADTGAVRECSFLVVIKGKITNFYSFR